MQLQRVVAEVVPSNRMARNWFVFANAGTLLFESLLYMQDAARIINKIHNRSTSSSRTLNDNKAELCAKSDNYFRKENFRKDSQPRSSQRRSRATVKSYSSRSRSRSSCKLNSEKKAGSALEPRVSRKNQSPSRSHSRKAHVSRGRIRSTERSRCSRRRSIDPESKSSKLYRSPNRTNRSRNGSSSLSRSRSRSKNRSRNNSPSRSRSRSKSRSKSRRLRNSRSRSPFKPKVQKTPNYNREVFIVMLAVSQVFSFNAFTFCICRLAKVGKTEVRYTLCANLNLSLILIASVVLLASGKTTKKYLFTHF